MEEVNHGINVFENDLPSIRGKCKVIEAEVPHEASRYKPKKRKKKYSPPSIYFITPEPGAVRALATENGT